jgi:tetratricopeptide (TPR) repeat protein
MTILEAKEILAELERKTSLSDEEEHELIETLEFMIEKTGEPRYSEWLGGIYYDKRIFDLALKYYELAEAQGSVWAWNGLGYIWYYGRTGTVDYEKAYHYFTKVREYEGDDIDEFTKIEASFKIADMYKNGYFVEKDEDRYVEMIEDLYKQIQDSNLFLPTAEVYTRLASIRARQGRKEEAIDLYYDARNDLIYRLTYNRFFGDINRINWLVNDLYELIEFDPTDFDLYDLFYLLKEEHLVSFKYRRKIHEIESKLSDEGEMNIRFDDRWYRNITDMFIRQDLSGESIEHEYLDLNDWRLEK